MCFETLIYEKKNNYVQIRFNRPHRLNAVIEQFYTELLSALSKAEEDREIRAILLTGEGRVFCVGADMKEHSNGERSQYQRRQYLQLGNEVCEAIFRNSKPIVAAVNGYALGAGAEMACACDFVIMAENAQIGFPEVSIGTCVGGGVSQFLPRLVGLAKARELIFLGTKICGPQAESIGLITRAVPDEMLQEEAEVLIEQLSTKAPVSMRLVKALLNNASHVDLATQLQLELDSVFVCTTTKDWQEGVDAFAQKRSPVFEGH